VFDVKIDSPFENPYASTLLKMAAVEFPGSTRSDKCAVFEAVVAELVGTKQLRYGPTPSPEVLVSIREVVREAMAKDLPIHVLVPWGGSKQGDHGIDIAELMAMKQLLTLADKLKLHYPPGLSVRLRLEDASDIALFARMSGRREKTAPYCDAVELLARIVLPGIEIYRESSLIAPDSFVTAVDALVPTFYEAMQNNDPAARAALLGRIGWKGDLPQSQLACYRNAYAKFYSNMPAAARDMLLARYFACAIVRRDLKLSGAIDGTKQIMLCFWPPVPTQDATRRLFYRTIPERYSNQHRAPWIGKGYVRIMGDVATPAIAGWDGDGETYVPSALVISSAIASVRLASEYRVVE